MFKRSACEFGAARSQAAGMTWDSLAPFQVVAMKTVVEEDAWVQLYRTSPSLMRGRLRGTAMFHSSEVVRPRLQKWFLHLFNTL